MSFDSKPHLHLAKNLWKALIQPGDLAIDATLGNGYDALFLCELGADVIGMDIQASAIESAKVRLKNQKITLLHRSHADLISLNIPKPIKLIVYNLGYLPGQDKIITTQVETTLESVRQGLGLLDAGGALSITCYPGHDEGLKEEAALIDWASRLDPKKWSVCHYRWLNRHRSPSLLWIVSAMPRSNPESNFVEIFRLAGKERFLF